MAASARESGRLIPDLHLFLCSPRFNPTVSPPSSATEHLMQPPLPPCTHLQWTTQTDLTLLTFAPQSIFLSHSQIQWAFPGNPQSTLTWKASRLTADLHFSLHSFKSNVPVSSQAWSRPSAVAPPHSLPHFQDTKQMLEEHLAFLPPKSPRPSHSAHFHF